MTYQNEGPSLAKIAFITAAATYPGRTAFFVTLGFGLLVLLSPENWEVMVLAWVAFMAYIMVVGFVGKLTFGTAEEVIHGHYQERSESSAISWFAWIIFLLVAAWFLFGGKAHAAEHVNCHLRKNEKAAECQPTEICKGLVHIYDDDGQKVGVVGVHESACHFQLTKELNPEAKYVTENLEVTNDISPESKQITDQILKACPLDTYCRVAMKHHSGGSYWIDIVVSARKITDAEIAKENDAEGYSDFVCNHSSKSNPERKKFGCD